KIGLEQQGFPVDVAQDGTEGDDKAETAEYDIIILDPLLPGEDGRSHLKRWRSRGLKSLVLVLTACSSSADRGENLDLGADDYWAKPFQLEELLTRLRALLRRGHIGKDWLLRVHDLVINTDVHTVKRSGKPIHVTPLEYALLELLASHRG